MDYQPNPARRSSDKFENKPIRTGKNRVMVDGVEYIEKASVKPYIATVVLLVIAALIMAGQGIGYGVHNILDVSNWHNWYNVPILAALAFFGFKFFKLFSTPRRVPVKVKKAKVVKQPKHELVLTGSNETDELLKKADADLKSIKKGAEAIAKNDPAFAETLDGLVVDAYKLVDYNSEHPSQTMQLRRVYNYYLPTLDKLTASYLSFEKLGATGDNVTKSKAEIRAAAETMKDLFEKQFDKLYGDAARDVTSEVDVLETMLSSDGIKATIN